MELADPGFRFGTSRKILTRQQNHCSLLARALLAATNRLGKLISLRDVELLLAERGIVVSYEAERRRCKEFGQTFASRLRHRRPRPGASGISMRSSFESKACSTIFGARWIRKRRARHSGSGSA